MEWAEETIIKLRELWAEGHSTAEIGRRLGVSKNAVVGKAHRLDLSARPSPIRREGGRSSSQRPAVRRLAGPTLPPLACTGIGGATPLQPAPRMVPTAASAAPRPVTASSSRVAPSPPPRPYGRVITCCWPIGEPGTRNFRFCDAESVPGKPYCADHAQLAYVKVRDRRDDAA
jgi:GcrA cell cycle regulator